MPDVPLADAQQLREIGNPGATRDAIFTRVLDATRQFKPIVSQRYTLALKDPQYEGADRFSKADEKAALLGGQSLGRRLRGTWQLIDTATQQPIDERRMTLATVPYLTDRGTFIFRGNDYGMANQMRLRPGIFTRTKESGELESHINVAKGRGHHYLLNPETGVFSLSIGQAKLPLISALRVMGATDSQLRNAWGNDIYVANARKDNPAAIRKLYSKFYRTAPPPGMTKEEAVRNAFKQMTLDPEVTKRTLGEAYENVDLNTMLAATSKLMRVYRGEDTPDDRDALSYQRTFGPEDIFAERVAAANDAARRMLWKAAVSGSLQRAQPGTFAKSIDGALLNSGLANSIEEINPAELFDQQHRITRMGTGGIASVDSIPDDSRQVQSSHLGYIDPVQTPEGYRLGVDTRIAIQTKRGKDGSLYSKFIDAKSGKPVWRAPQQVADSVIAFPGELESKRDQLRTIVGGELKYKPRNEVDYQLTHMTSAFGPLASMIPLKSASFPQRVAMGSRMLTQALPLVNAEAPFVQSGIPGEERSFEELYGDRMGAIRSQQNGTVIDITPTEIKIRGTDRRIHNVELYNNQPYNRKTVLNNTPTVQVGDRVKAGQLLARSNFTDKHGTTALGLNARVAYLPYKGYNFEDAIVVSESFAKRASSEHMYQNDLDLDADTRSSKNAYVSIFPGKYNKEQLSRYDADGVIKVGETVKSEEPLILAVRNRRTGPKLGRRARAFADASVMWDHHTEGTVTDVFKGKKAINVIVKSIQPTQVGDKFSGRYGDKGVCAAIIPDAKMPRAKDGKPFEVLLNPLGVISRGNPAQIIESALGKIVEKTGKPYRLTDFDSEDNLVQWALGELKKHGLKSLETVVDPENGRQIDDIHTGNRFMLKLHHTAEAKIQGRATGAYTAEGLPAKGGKGGSKKVGMLELSALLSHGAYDNIRDASLVRGQQNEEYWRQIMSGYSPPAPKIPFVYEKFVESLRGAGINPIANGTKIHVMALTGDAAKQLTGNRELKNADTVDWRLDRLTPTPGGLFDEQLTGGHGGKKWSYYRLSEPLPNPAMEEPMRYILGLTKKQFENVLAGKEHFGNDPAAIDDKSSTGPQALFTALERMNLDKEIQQAEAAARSSRATKRDTAIRRLRYLKNAKRLGQHPKDWFLDRVPVLPPAFRPVSVMQQTGTPLVADANYLYKELFDANHAFEELSKVVDDTTDERLNVYKAFRSVTGLGNPLATKNREQGVQGILKQVFGASPKYGVFQRKLLGSSVDLVGRATIVPNPNLNMDQVGLPEEQAWTVYRPFVVRRLVRRGMSKLQALKQTEDRTSDARRELLAEMDKRPVIITRAPVLHKYGVLAAEPQLTSSTVLELPPLIVKGFNADFDGDAMQFHVPGTDEAIQEARTSLLPSQNLLAAGDFKPIHTPTNEYIGGLWNASTKRNPKKGVKVFRNMQDVLAAYNRGEIGADQQVEIVEP